MHSASCLEHRKRSSPPKTQAALHAHQTCVWVGRKRNRKLPQSGLADLGTRMRPHCIVNMPRTINAAASWLLYFFINRAGWRCSLRVITKQKWTCYFLCRKRNLRTHQVCVRFHLAFTLGSIGKEQLVAEGIDAAYKFVVCLCVIVCACVCVCVHVCVRVCVCVLKWSEKPYTLNKTIKNHLFCLR